MCNHVVGCLCDNMWVQVRADVQLICARVPEAGVKKGACIHTCKLPVNLGPTDFTRMPMQHGLNFRDFNKLHNDTLCSAMEQSFTRDFAVVQWLGILSPLRPLTAGMRHCYSRCRLEPLPHGPYTQQDAITKCKCPIVTHRGYGHQTAGAAAGKGDCGRPA